MSTFLCAAAFWGSWVLFVSWGFWDKYHSPKVPSVVRTWSRYTGIEDLNLVEYNDGTFAVFDDPGH